MTGSERGIALQRGADAGLDQSLQQRRNALQRGVRKRLHQQVRLSLRARVCVRQVVRDYTEARRRLPPAAWAPRTGLPGRLQRLERVSDLKSTTHFVPLYPALELHLLKFSYRGMQ